MKADKAADKTKADVPPTPMEELANKVSSGLFDHLKKTDDKESD